MLVEERPMASCSILWKLILGTNSFLSQGIHCSLGNGRKILFGDDWSYTNNPLADDLVIGSISEACITQFCKWVADYICNNKWVDLTIVDPSLCILQDYLNLMHIDLSRKEDLLTWA